MSEKKAKGNRSAISLLPKDIRLQVDILIADGATIDEIVEHLKKYNISRSSVGRYTKKNKSDILAKIKNHLELTAAMGEGLELDEENNQDRQVLAMLRYLISDYQTKAIGGEIELEPKDMQALGRALKDTIFSREKIEDIKIKARKAALEEASEKAAKVLNDKLGDKKQVADVLGAIKEAYGV